jgi:hypothetical protein
MQLQRLPNTNTFIPVYEYSITVTLFVDASQNIARPTIPIAFGDGDTGTFTLNASTNTNGIQEKMYSGTHVYPGSGNYLVTYLDTFRIAGIKNISNSQSQQIRVALPLLLNFSLGQNSSPIVEVYPLNLSVIDNQVVYTPSVSDADGDSLSFSFVNCFGANYYLPTGAAIEGTSGAIHFSKDSIGLYAFCIEVKEWRKNLNGGYVNIGTSQVDLVINISNTVGLNEENDNTLELKSYPNPVKEKLHLAFKNKVAADKISITSIFGQQVFNSEDMRRNSKVELDLSFLPGGVYFLKIENGKGQKIFKFVKE